MKNEQEPLYQRDGKKTWWVKRFKNAVGTIIPRHTTETTNFRKAMKYFGTLENLEKWEGRKSARRTFRAEKAKGPLLTEVLETWVKEAKNGRSRETTQTQRRRKVMRAWIRPMAELDIHYLGEPRTEHARALQKEWMDRGLRLNTIIDYRTAISTMYDWLIRHKELDNIKNPWLAVQIPSEIEPTEEQRRERRPADNGIATLPLDMDGDENWQKIRNGVVPFLTSREYRTNPLATRPETFLALVELLYETGLRRGDAVFFRPDWIEWCDGEFFYSCDQEKTGGRVTVRLSPELVAKLQSLPLLPWHGRGKYKEWSTAGRYPFWDGSGDTFENYLGDNLGTPLRELGQCLGIPGNVRPHRFRDSFAVNLLNRLVGKNVDSMRVLCEALGHKTIKTTEKYYAPRVLSRVRTLLMVLADAQRKAA